MPLQPGAHPNVAASLQQLQTAGVRKVRRSEQRFSVQKAPFDAHIDESSDSGLDEDEVMELRSSMQQLRDFTAQHLEGQAAAQRWQQEADSLIEEQQLAIDSLISQVSSLQADLEAAQHELAATRGSHQRADAETERWRRRAEEADRSVQVSAARFETLCAELAQRRDELAREEAPPPPEWLSQLEQARNAAAAAEAEASRLTAHTRALEGELNLLKDVKLLTLEDESARAEMAREIEDLRVELRGLRDTHDAEISSRGLAIEAAVRDAYGQSTASFFGEVEEWRQMAERYREEADEACAALEHALSESGRLAMELEFARTNRVHAKEEESFDVAEGTSAAAAPVDSEHNSRGNGLLQMAAAAKTEVERLRTELWERDVHIAELEKTSAAKTEVERLRTELRERDVRIAELEKTSAALAPAARDGDRLQKRVEVLEAELASSRELNASLADSNLVLSDNAKRLGLEFRACGTESSASNSREGEVQLLELKRRGADAPVTTVVGEGVQTAVAEVQTADCGGCPMHSCTFETALQVFAKQNEVFVTELENLRRKDHRRRTRRRRAHESARPMTLEDQHGNDSYRSRHRRARLKRIVQRMEDVISETTTSTSTLRKEPQNESLLVACVSLRRRIERAQQLAEDELQRRCHAEAEVHILRELIEC